MLCIECVDQQGPTQAYLWLIEARDTFWLSERVKLNSCVVGIKEFDDHVKVRCVDGKEYKVILKIIRNITGRKIILMKCYTYFYGGGALLSEVYYDVSDWQG